jgi:flagellar M-ring protein FliF
MGAILQLLKDLGPVRIGAIIGVTIAFIIGFVILAMRLSSPPKVSLYSELDLKESAQIVSSLEAKKIPYEIRNNGSQILVPEDKMLRLRMSLAQEGLPSKGSVIGYEIFDQGESFGASNFMQNVNLLRALEGELSRTIASMQDIEAARVHLVMPKRELFTRDRQEPSASVVLKIKGNKRLDKNQTNAISHLVATAVPGLDVNKITIVDSSGKPVKLGAQKPDDPGVVASAADDYRAAYEGRLKSVIEDLLSRSVGEGKVIAHVSAEINFDRQVTNSEIFDPEGRVPRSVQTIEENETNEEKQQDGNVSVANNVPNSAANSAGNQSSNRSSRVDETTNFEISKTIKNHVSETGSVKRLSIAVMVDGTYKTDGNTGESSYVARSDQELKIFEGLVKSAVGFDESRKDLIQVSSMPFYADQHLLKEETLVDWLKKEMRGLVQTLIVGVVVILIIVLVVRPLVQRAFELSKTEIEDPEQQAALFAPPSKSDVPETSDDEDDLVDLEQMSSRIKSSTVRSVNDVIAKYPDEAITILRSWMNKD